MDAASAFGALFPNGRNFETHFGPGTLVPNQFKPLGIVLVLNGSS